MEEKKLTVLMSFKNERDEVALTCKNIRETAGDKVDIIVLNDDSDKDFDYVESLKPYNVEYNESEQRMGSSVGKQWCVDKCKTPYFLILDAHCRMITEDWYDKAIEILEKNEDCVYCCSVQYFTIEDGVEKTTSPTAYGAYYDYKPPKPLGCTWNMNRISEEEFKVPCILGANYLCSKRWWDYIGGFNGLRLYGREEPFVSRKSYMLGGCCKCIPQILTWHKKRKDNKFPYHIEYNEIMHNEIFMSYTLMNDKYDEMMKYYEQNINPVQLKVAQNIFAAHMDEAETTRQFVESNRKMTIDKLDDYNNKFCDENKIVRNFNKNVV